MGKQEARPRFVGQENIQNSLQKFSEQVNELSKEMYHVSIRSVNLKNLSSLIC